MNNTETFIKQLYESLKITEPEQLTIENVSEKMSLPVHYWEYASRLTEYIGQHQMFLNKNLNEQKQWQEYGHEMCHYSWHQGSQEYLKESYASYQETKANYFAYHFCVPSFMLERNEIMNVYDIMNQYNVDFEFAIRRLDMHEGKLMTKNIIYIM